MIPILDVSHSIVSAVILSLSKYGLLVMVTLISSSSVMSHTLLYYVSIINLVIGTIIALTQYRYVRILAWTSMIQIGYVLLIVHSNYHSISLLFFELYTVYTVLLIILYNNNRLTSITNISNLMGTTQILLMIAMLYSVAGIPYAALFWIKLDILLHVPTQSFTIALFITFLSSIVYVRLIKQLSFSQYATY
jgi:NADH:ubiquinone oxidoreductase subunit 2 (subunit N)